MRAYSTRVPYAKKNIVVRISIFYNLVDHTEIYISRNEKNNYQNTKLAAIWIFSAKCETVIEMETFLKILYIDIFTARALHVLILRARFCNTIRAEGAKSVYCLSRTASRKITLIGVERWPTPHDTTSQDRPSVEIAWARANSRRNT